MRLRSRKPLKKQVYRGDAQETLPPELMAIFDKYRGQADALITLLEEIQHHYGYLPQQHLAYAAKELRIPFSKLYGAATFYTMLSTDPAGAKQNTLRVCDGPACWLRGAGTALNALKVALDKNWSIERSSCLGLCDHAPAALLNGAQFSLNPAQLEESLKAPPLQARAYRRPRPGETRVLLADTHKIIPAKIETSLEQGAYQGLAAALQSAPAEVISLISDSKLRGRGGAGFPTGLKWKFVAETAAEKRYIVCNADESEPLVFKDRALIDSNPHLLLEGMAIAAYAVGAAEGYIYIRGEYAAQAELLETAIAQAAARGKLGRNIEGSSFSFNIHLHRGAGAYICGEETALLESLEGKRGEPRMRPPYPTVSGFRGFPTVVNNVETFANVPAILRRGAQWYRRLSPGKERAGTKLYTVLGSVNNPGLFEAPFGLTLRQIIDEFGGGMTPGSTFNIALTGGAAGTLVNRDFLDTPVDYASMQDAGISLGAGAFLIADESVSAAELLRELLHFFESESCGKCAPCRIGVRRARQALDRARVEGVAANKLAQTAHTLQYASFCGLGQSVAIPVQSALANFPAEFAG